MRRVRGDDMCAPSGGRRWRSNIPPELLAELNEMARQTGRTKSELLREGVAALVSLLSPEERERFEAILRSQRARRDAARRLAATCRGRKVTA